MVAKKVITWLVIAFAGFYLITEPASAADAVRGAVEAVGNAFESLITFFTQLFD